MIDILQKIIEHDISEERAYEIYDEVMEKYHNNNLNDEPKDALKMDNYEWTAFCHGASFNQLAKWRKQGWSDSCAKCGTKINYKEYGWAIKNDELMGVSCCNK